MISYNLGFKLNKYVFERFVRLLNFFYANNILFLPRTLNIPYLQRRL